MLHPSIPFFSQGLTSLTRLSLPGCKKLRGEGDQALSAADYSAALHHLTQLRFANLHCYSQAIKLDAIALPPMPHLTTLCISQHPFAFYFGGGRSERSVASATLRHVLELLPSLRHLCTHELVEAAVLQRVRPDFPALARMSFTDPPPDMEWEWD